MTTSAPATPNVAALSNKNVNSPLRSKEVLLPLNKVKLIMKSSPEVENIGTESLFLITKATELFIMYLTKLSQRHGNVEELTYADLASIVARKDSMEFLQDIVPKKIKYSEYLEIMEKENQVEDSLY
ncbi:chromatin accessibility complex protein 1 isoform X2 [Eurytemora carolleeae]|uniref:chromatin accessibility complex protein 1 isoform X1 n=1 Tax=Eurytemora carolleeae TaxID=1294199 RepID=UPI000C787E36|nr:chromatin accessibility complex protein 1 isoform X1 [Eurytemora carolleeae]XP_023341998.1 chromatin accessibility complex protein 1 isoform X2 [Eurytemora carolleeae]|eukprot:XP_023341997.1 chromatin accessibility complex protein 1-like isoform X1 [Eurytemora affinis]